MRALLLGWIILTLIAALALVPGRYTARADLSFDLATQPPAAAVRGIMQVVSSRDMAFAVLDRLPQDEMAELGGSGPFPAWLTGDHRSPKDRATARLMANLSITPRQGGRVLDFSFTSPSPTLSTAVVEGYLAAFGALQSDVSARAEDGQSLPRLGTAIPVTKPRGRDLPPMPLVLGLGAAALLLATATLRVTGRGRMPRTQQSAPSLPPLADSLPRVAWLDGGHGAALDADEVVSRLAALVANKRDRAEKQLVIVTSDAPTRAAAICAIDLARHLSQENRVALVSLDGASGELAALISDPWAPGMAEMLFGVAGFGETIHRDPRSRAHIIPPGRDTRTGASVVGAERLGLILTALRQTYDFVIVAAPVLDPGFGAAQLADLSPYVVCVDSQGEEASVEPYAALAGQGFGHVLMVRMALDAPAASPLPFVHAAPSLSAA